MPYTCTSTQTGTNATIAAGRPSPTCYAPVAVTVTASSTSTGLISISALDIYGYPQTYAGLTWGDETIMWAACPSTVTDDKNPNSIGPVPPVNATGTLYLSSYYIRANNIQGTPKWPTCLGYTTTFSAPLSVAPSSLILSGMELADGLHNRGSVDLWDPSCAPRQTIDLTEASVTVLLTPKGFARMGVSFPVESLLAAAVSEIQRPTSPRETARAWEVVATAMDQMDCGLIHQDKALSLKAEIKKVLPDLKR